MQLFFSYLINNNINSICVIDLSCFGCRVTEGYGMTETSCVISSMDGDDNLTGHVGSPSPSCGENLSIKGQTNII